MRTTLFFLIIFVAPVCMLAQKTPIWKYSISWKVSEVIHKEIGVDYDFLKYDKHIFSISSGFRWHNLEKSLRYDGTKTNFFVATNKYHHDYIKTNKLPTTIKIRSVIQSILAIQNL